MCGWSTRCRAPTLPPFGQLINRRRSPAPPQLEPAGPELRGCWWPDDLASCATRWRPVSRLPVQRGRPTKGRARDASQPDVGDDTTLISPVTMLNARRHAARRQISILGFTIVRLDPAVIRDTMLTTLTTRHFHGDDAEVDYRVAVVQKDDPARWSGNRSRVRRMLITSAPDVTQAFMGPRPDQMFVFARGLRGANTLPAAASSTAPGQPRKNRRARTHGSSKTTSSSRWLSAKIAWRRRTGHHARRTAAASKASGC